MELKRVSTIEAWASVINCYYIQLLNVCYGRSNAEGDGVFSILQGDN